MIQVSIFTALKNTDLECLSAQSTIVGLLGVDQLSSLHRWTRWDLSFDAPVSDDDLAPIFDQSYYLANPNREQYALHRIPAPVSDINRIYPVQVGLRRPVSEDKLVTKIAQRFDLPLNGLVRSTIWELVLADASDNRSEAEAFLDRQVVTTTSQSQGVLVNPLYETSTFLNPVDLYQG